MNESERLKSFGIKQEFRFDEFSEINKTFDLLSP
jgi:hypothetical protein